jgi:endonuclease YncB( thermonuclease family)
MARRGKAIWSSVPWWERRFRRPTRRPWVLGVAGIGAGAILGLALVATGIVVPAGPIPRIEVPAPRNELLATGIPTLTAPPSRESIDMPSSPGGEAPAEIADSTPVELRGRIGFCRGRAGNNCVIDGDSFILDGESIRLAAIDAPEMGNPGCAAEADLAQAAKSRLQELLNDGAIVLVRNADRDQDRFGRSLRDAEVDGRSVSDTLVAEGLARPWRGQKENWC